MNIEFKEAKLTEISKHDAVVLFVFSDKLDQVAFHECISSEDQDHLDDLIGRKVITGKAQTSFFLPAQNEHYKGILVLGLGTSDALTPEGVRRAMGKGLGALTSSKVSTLGAFIPASVAPGPIIDAIILGQYSFDRYKSSNDEASLVSGVTFYSDDLSAADVDEAQSHQVMALNANWARDLGNTPGQDLTPTKLAEIAQTLANNDDVECDVLDEEKLKALGMGGILAVGRGSREESRLIVLKYKSSHEGPTVALVGKGITFDTGGISLKPGAKMEDMRFDMCGSAAVLGAFKSIVELKPAVNVLCVVPAAENMPDGLAIKPGDIIKTYSGKTVEVYNTDAEGRLVLADALAYTIDKYGPDKIVDVATLTGACLVALGHFASAMMSTDEEAVAGLTQAGDLLGERTWRLPVWDDYDKGMDGNDADICNISSFGREAGSITAGCFLKRFVGDTPWTHLDIAGTAWNVPNVSYLKSRYASGYGARLLAQWVCDLNK